jgi:hypothetical protein
LQVDSAIDEGNYSDIGQQGRFSLEVGERIGRVL